jgi:hypothetical protein
MKILSSINSTNDLVSRNFVNSYATTTGTNTYSITLVPTPSSLSFLEGQAIRVKVGSTSNGVISLNVNGLGAINVLLSDGTQANTWRSDSIYTVVYNGSNFIQQGEGGIVANNASPQSVKYDETIALNDVIESYYRDFTTGFNGSAFSTSGVTVSGTPPTNGAPSVVSWSPNGLYLAVGYSTTPFFAIYKRSGDTLTRLPATTNVSAGTASEPLSMTWSFDSSSLVVCFATTPFIYHYKRYSGDYFFRDTASNAGNPTIVDIDPTNTYLLCATTTAPTSPIRIVKRGTQDFTNLLATGAVGWAGVSINNTMNGLTWHPSGNYFAALYNEFSTYLAIFTKSVGSDTFTLTNRFEVQSGNGSGFAYTAKFSPDGNFIAIAYLNAPVSNANIRVYSFSEGSLTQVFSGVNLSGYRCITWSPDSNYFIASGVLQSSASTNTPIMIKKNANNTFTVCDTPSSALTPSYRFTSWSPDGNYVALGDYATTNANPEIRKVVPANAPYLFRKVTPSTSTVGTFDKVYGIAKESGTAGQTKKASILVNGNLL